MNRRVMAVTVLAALVSQLGSAQMVGSYGDLIQDYACQPNDAILASTLQIDAARQRLDSSQTDKWMPEVKLASQLYYGDGEPTGFFALKNGIDPAVPNINREGRARASQLNLSLPLYKEGDWYGQQGLDQVEADTNLKLATAKADAMRQDVIALASRYYFDALLYSAQQEFLAPLVDTRKHQLSAMEQKVSAGLSASADYYTINSAYLTAREQLQQAIAKRNSNIAQLGALLGSEVSLNNANATASLAELADIKSRTLVAGQLEDLVLVNPQVAMLMAKLAHERKKQQSEKGKLLPNLNLYSRFNSGTSIGSGGDGEDHNYSEYGLELSYDLGEVVSASGEAKALKDSIAALVAELDYLKKIKTLEARGLVSELAEKRARIEVAESQVNRRRKTLQRDQEKYSSGLLGIDDLVESEDNNVRAQLEQLSAYRDAWLSLIGARVFANQVCSGGG